jgi:hypothetical protein
MAAVSQGALYDVQVLICPDVHEKPVRSVELHMKLLLKAVPAECLDGKQWKQALLVNYSELIVLLGLL